MNRKQSVNEKSYLTILYFPPFSLPQQNWNILISSVVLETKIKIVFTILIAIHCSADITKLSYLLITLESTRVFLKCSEFLFLLYTHLLLLEKQEDGRKIFHGNLYAASWTTGFEVFDPEIFIKCKCKQLQSWNGATEGLLNLCMVINDGNGRAKIKCL